MITVYGPPQGGAGTRVLLSDSSIPLALGKMGTSLFVGPYPKGPIGKCVIHSGGKDDYARVRKTDLLVEDQTPLAARHFYDPKFRNKGTLITFRVADGNEKEADLPIFDRLVDTSVRGAAQDTQVNGQVGTLYAASEGCWGGADIYYGGAVANAAAAAVGSTWATAQANQWKKNQLKGGYLYIASDTRARLILSNTALGVITVNGDFSDLTLAAAPAYYHVVKESVDAQGLRKELAVKITDGAQNAGGCFGMQVFEDLSLYENPWNDLSLDTTNPQAWELIINEAAARMNQFEVEADSDFAGDPALEWLKPANFAEIPAPAGVVTNTVTFEVFRYILSGGTGAETGYIGRSTWTAGSAIAPHVYTLTVLAGAATYSVAAHDFMGREIASGLPNGTIGVAYAAPFAHLSGHTLTAGGVPLIAGNVITVYCRALPANLAARGCYFYPYAFAATGTGSKDVTTSYRVTANTYQQITLAPSTDLTGIAVPPGLASALGTTPGTYLNNAIYTVKATLYIDGVVSGAALNVSTAGTGGATDTATQVAASINAAITLAGGAALRFGAYVETVLGVDYVGLKATAVFDNYGPATSIVVDKTATINPIIGFSAVADTTAYGATPTTCRLEWAQCFNGGRDGHHDLSNEDYTTTAFDAEESPILELIPENLGLIKLFTPGEDGETIQQAAVDFAKTSGCFYWGNIPAATASEAAAKLWLRTYIQPNRHAAWIFPSYGDLSENPFGGLTAYECTILGAAAGIMGDKANEFQGYQKAPAGIAWRFDPLFRRLATDPSDEPAPVKDWLLNPAGIQQCIHQAGAIFLFGDEAPDYNHQGTVWIHKVLCLLHITAEIRANLLQYTYDVSDDGLRSKVVNALGELLRAHYNAGWFKGTSFSGAVQIVSNAANNPPAVQALGKTVAGVSLEIVETNKNTEIQLGTSGVAVGV